MMVGTKLSVLILLAVTGIESARILAYFPTPSISHQIVFRPLTHALARRGHEVTVVTTDPAFPPGKAPENLTEIDVQDISYNIWRKLLKYYKGNKKDLILQVQETFKSIADIFDQQMDSPQVKKVLENKDKHYFDLLIVEMWCRPLFGIVGKFDAPVIVISSFGAAPAHYSLFGAPMHPLLYPTPGMQRIYNLTLFERGLELVKYVGLEYLVSSTEHYDLKIMEKHFGFSNFLSLRERYTMLFLNEHPIWTDNRPVPPSVVYIGGIYQPERKELPQDLKTFLDSSKQGAIYVSFGTNVLPSLLSPQKIEIMTKVFSKLPYNVLWKWDKEELPGQTDNIKIAKWFPQPDILNHPNMKLFITQGGMQSTEETIDAAVPVIGIPMFADQWYNVEKYVLHKIGLHLDISAVTEELFEESIKRVIENKSYKENISKLRALMKEYPIKPLDNAVWWAEHVIKYGGSHLQSPAVRMSWTEYYEVKLIIIILGILISTLTILVLIAKRIINLACKLCSGIFKLKTN